MLYYYEEIRENVYLYNIHNIYNFRCVSVKKYQDDFRKSKAKSFFI